MSPEAPTSGDWQCTSRNLFINMPVKMTLPLSQSLPVMYTRIICTWQPASLTSLTPPPWRHVSVWHSSSFTSWSARVRDESWMSPMISYLHVAFIDIQCIYRGLVTGMAGRSFSGWIKHVSSEHANKSGFVNRPWNLMACVDVLY